MGREGLTTRTHSHTRIRLALTSTVAIAALTAIIFWPAGRLDWWQGWLYFAIVFVSLLINYIYLRRVNPDVIEHRLYLGDNTKRWDKVWSVAFTPVFLATYIVAGFDAVRYEWSAMSAWLWPFGLLCWVAGFALLVWAMGVNPFFEKTVRLQSDRGQYVIDTGPYAYVRHPGYLGFFGWCLATPLLLGSWWALVPALLSLAGMVIRTALEDRMLQRELPGYSDYAGSVRYRLLPGLW